MPDIRGGWMVPCEGSTGLVAPASTSGAFQVWGMSGGRLPQPRIRHRREPPRGVLPLSGDLLDQAHDFVALHTSPKRLERDNVLRWLGDTPPVALAVLHGLANLDNAPLGP